MCLQHVSPYKIANSCVQCSASCSDAFENIPKLFDRIFIDILGLIGYQGRELAGSATFDVKSFSDYLSLYLPYYTFLVSFLLS